MLLNSFHCINIWSTLNGICKIPWKPEEECGWLPSFLQSTECIPDWVTMNPENSRRGTEFWKYCCKRSEIVHHLSPNFREINKRKLFTTPRKRMLGRLRWIGPVMGKSPRLFPEKETQIKSLFDQGKLASEEEIAETRNFELVIAESELMKAYHCRALTIKICKTKATNRWVVPDLL